VNCSLRPPWFLLAALAMSIGVQAQPVSQVPFGALTLRDAQQILVARNREVQAARRLHEAARADTLTAGALPNPTLSIQSTDISPWAGLGSGPLWDKRIDTTVALSQLIERGGKRGLRIDTAQNIAAAAEQELANAHRQQRLALVAAYYDLLLAQEKAAISAENTQLYERTLEAADRRLKAGDIAPADISRILVDALRTQNEAQAAETERLRAALTLAYLIGAEARATELRAADPWPSVDPSRVTTISDEMLDQRPDVRAARSRIDAAQSARELAKRLRTRDVSVFVQFERFPVVTTGSAANSFGVGVSVPLFTNYYFEGEIARAEADYNAATDGLERTRAQARTELERARAEAMAAAERLRRYDATLLPEAQKSAEFGEFAYRNGAIGVMDLLDARRSLRAAQIEAAQARADYAKALGAWRAGLGESME
jgi:outer membrane protein, heavy metal efflux system